MELLTVILVSTIILIRNLLLKNLKDLYNTYNLGKKFVGPKAYPLIENAHLFPNNMKDKLLIYIKNFIRILYTFIRILFFNYHLDFTPFLLDQIKEYSPINIPVRIWLFLKLYLIIDQPESIMVRFISFILIINTWFIGFLVTILLNLFVLYLFFFSFLEYTKSSICC